MNVKFPRKSALKVFHDEPYSPNEGEYVDRRRNRRRRKKEYQQRKRTVIRTIYLSFLCWYFYLVGGRSFDEHAAVGSGNIAWSSWRGDLWIWSNMFDRFNRLNRAKFVWKFGHQSCSCRNHLQKICYKRFGFSILDSCDLVASWNQRFVATIQAVYQLHTNPKGEKNGKNENELIGYSIDLDLQQIYIESNHFEHFVL